MATLQDWFDRNRVRGDDEPTGWSASQMRAVKGHEFGLKLNGADKRALIVFLKAL